MLGAALAIFTAGVVSAAIDWTWELPACFGLVVLAAGLLAGPGARVRDRIRRRASCGERLEGARASRRGRGSGSGVATLLVGWAAIWAGGVLFLTEIRLGDSRQEATDGNLEAAAEDARSAIKIEPWAAGPRLQLALVEELAGDLPAANREVSEAIDRAPDNWQLWFVRTRLDVKSGDIDGARRALERARELNPRAPFLSQ